MISIILGVMFLAAVLLMGWLTLDRDLTTREAWQQQFDAWLLKVSLTLDRDLTTRDAWQQQFHAWLQSAGVESQNTSPTKNNATPIKSLTGNSNLSAPEAEAEPVSPTPPETTLTPQPEALPNTLTQTSSAQQSAAPPAPETQLQIEQPLPDSPLLDASTATINPLEGPLESQPPSALQITFDFDSASLSENAKEVLDDLARTFIRAGAGSITVAGYADERGDRVYNMVLSRRRADAVAQYLVARGVDENYLSVQGLGIYSEANQALSDETASLGADGRIVQLEIEFDPLGR